MRDIFNSLVRFFSPAKKGKITKPRRGVHPGDIFSVRLEGGTGFFQYLGEDSSMLNSSLICVFRGRVDDAGNGRAEEIVSSSVDFYAHVFIRLGIKLGTWKKHSHAAVVPFKKVWFRDSLDYGNPSIKVSERWWVWQPGKERTNVHGQAARLKDSHIGVVVTPDDIAGRMASGSYPFIYPTYPDQTKA